MNRLLPDAPPAPINEPMPSQSPIPGQRPHLQAQARELGVPVRGTKAQIWQRIAAKQGENVGKRVRAPREAQQQAAGPIIPPMPAEMPQNRLLASSAPDMAGQPADPFDETLSQFEAFLRARS